MGTMLDNLKKYFEITSPDQIKKDWDAVTKYDQVNIPKVDYFLREQKSRHKGDVLLWLDDIRNPFLSNYKYQYPHLKMYHDMYFNNYRKCQIVWVQNYNQFEAWIYENGLPEDISFDHDLADEHYTPPKYWNDYQASKEYQDKQNYQEKTGMNCAKFLINYCMDYNKRLPGFFCHSANPVGKDNILGLLNNFKNGK